MSVRPLDPAPLALRQRGRALLKRLVRRPELRHATILTTGAVVAQIFLVGTAPILARLYSPADFGVLAVLLSVATISGSIGALCYEVAIVVPRSERAARALFSLSLYLSLIVGSLIGAGIVAAAALFPNSGFGHFPGAVALLFIPAIVLAALFNVLGYAHSRANQYWSVAASKVNQSLLPALLQIVLGLLRQGAFGLLVGRVIGMAVTVALLAVNLPKTYRLSEALTRRRLEILAAARAYKDFLLHVPRQLFVRGAGALAPILLLGAFGAAPAGLFFFAQRLVERPGALLGDALSRVPLRQFAKRRAAGQRLFKASLAYTLTCAAPIVPGVLALSLFARPVFHWLFGAQWIPAADYAIVMGMWAGVRMTSLPVSMLITVLRAQRASLIVDATFSARVLVIPLIAALGGGALQAIQAFVALSVIYHLIVFAMGLRAAYLYDKDLERGVTR